MTNAQYEKQFDTILAGEIRSKPYDDDQYVDYVKMNQVRINRWQNKGKLLPELVETVTSIEEKMQWLLITEPWCGDAAHSYPFISKLAALNPNIELIIQNRDAPNSEIDKYLTNGAKSIPILVVRDSFGNDLFSWGPRPSQAQDLYLLHRNDPMLSTDVAKNLQLWYNKNKGKDLQSELNELLMKTA